MNVRGVELTAVFMVYRVIIYSTQVSYSRQANYSSYTRNDTGHTSYNLHTPSKLLVYVYRYYTPLIDYTRHTYT